MSLHIPVKIPVLTSLTQIAAATDKLRQILQRVDVTRHPSLPRSRSRDTSWGAVFPSDGDPSGSWVDLRV